MSDLNPRVFAAALALGAATLSVSPASATVMVVFDQLTTNVTQSPTFQPGEGLYFEFSGSGYLDIGAPPGSFQYMAVDNVDLSGAPGPFEGNSLPHSSSSFFYLSGTHYVEITLEPAVDPVISVSFVTPTVPEPSTWAMMILGFCGLGFLANRRRKQACLVA